MNCISVHFSNYRVGHSLVVVRCKVDKEFFLEYTFSDTRGCWQHGMIYSWEKSGDIMDLTSYTEEELFQYSLVCEYSDPYKMIAVQRYVLENLKELSSSGYNSTWNMVY